jgi:hypothetical protein
MILTACSVNTQVQKPPPGEIPGVVINPGLNPEKGIDPFRIKSMQQVGEYLLVDVSYSGGCEEHDFSLETTGKYTATYPPELEITLKHDNKGDGCRGIIDRKLWFDLRELKYEGTNRVLLVVTNTNMTLEYNY